MLHSNTQGLIDYWRGLRGEARAPSRQALNPADFVEILPQIFMLSRDTPALPFRLAGGLLTELHGRGLRTTSFLDVWSGASRAAARDAAAAAARDAEPLVLYADADAEGARVGLEIMLAPLTGPGGRLDRLLGCYQPLTSLAALNGAAVTPLAHHFTLRLGAGERREAPRLRLVAVNGARL